MQSKTHSLIESIANTVSGFLISVLIGEISYAYYGIPVSTAQNLELTLIFTVASIIRSYAFRRLFNRWQTNSARRQEL